jgi:glycosyltransferase involved in cell wall biosynthesis
LFRLRIDVGTRDNPWVRILLVSQLYPGPEDPDLGVFVRDLETQLVARGHVVERAVLNRRSGGKRRYVQLARTTAARARTFAPDVVYAHFLVPSGLAAALGARAPLVVTAHGRDVRNVGALPGVRAATRYVARRAARVIAVSDYLRRELEEKVPEARGKTVVIPSGVDVDRFAPSPAPESARFLCVGSLTPRKNVLRLARAFEMLGEGTLTFVGDGPLRSELQGRADVELAGSVAHDQLPQLIAAARVVCQPSLIEPFGQALLEAMACGRPVVATRLGGPPEFVPPDAGVLVDPMDEAALAEAMRQSVSLPCPNPAGRAAAERFDVRRQAERVEEVLARAARDRRA